MSSFKILLGVLVCLLLLVAALALSPQVPYATGIPHPEFGTNILIGPNNIDQEAHTRWLGYLFGIGIIGVFWTFLSIGSRKKGNPTIMYRWIAFCFVLYIISFTMMTTSHWTYGASSVSDFVMMMPEPTAWMIYVMWFLPIIITVAFVIFFERAVISDEEIASFEEYIANRKQSE